MRAQKDPKTKKWYVQYRYTDWKGDRRKSTKRGFETKKAAEEWVRSFLQMQQSDLDMNFEDFVRIYLEDAEHRTREHTMISKRYIINKKILPYFGKKKVCEIRVSDVRTWQNHLLKEGFKATYLRSINSQLSAIFNHAVKYYNLRENPCAKAGSIGKNKADEMSFWTKEEFQRFADRIMDKQASYTAFMTLYWTGIRVGELLALTPADIDFEKHTLSITKSYQRLNKKDVITKPKTPKSIRTISIPVFLEETLREYLNVLYGIGDQERMFPYSKHFLEHEMKRGIQASGVKPIRIHDLRHSHASMLIELGFSPLEIAERLGHERIETTLNTYSHLYPDKQTKLAARLNSEYREGM